jgi:hypothetical protein
MKGGNQRAVSTINLGRLQYIRLGTAGPTERRRGSLGDVNEDWRIILKGILNKDDGRVWTGLDSSVSGL